MPNPIDPTLKVTRLETGYTPEAKRTGRPKKLSMPPLPAAIWEGMSDLERQWFEFFRDAYLQDYPDMKPTDQLCLLEASLEKVHLLRKHAIMFGENKLLTQGRQDPSATLLRWLDMMDCTRKARMKNAPKQSDEGNKVTEFLQSLSS